MIHGLGCPGSLLEPGEGTVFSSSSWGDRTTGLHSQWAPQKPVRKLFLFLGKYQSWELINKAQTNYIGILGVSHLGGVTQTPERGLHCAATVEDTGWEHCFSVLECVRSPNPQVSSRTPEPDA